MPSFLARVYITLKPGVNDPQGLTIRHALHQLGYTSVASVRAGKYLEIQMEAPDHQEATRQVEEMCRRLLANPVIETFRLQVEETS